MKDKLKKYLLPNLPYLFFVYLFDKLCQAVRLTPGLDVSEKLLHIGQGFQTAFASSAPSFHVLDICVGIFGAILVRLAVYLKAKNAKKYRRGVEYGSARWGRPEDIAPYIDPVPDWNIPLTRTESLTMTSRPKQPKYARNKNILVIGGSGNGEQMAANCEEGVRAALVWSDATARLAREHNDANVVAVGARQHTEEEALALIDAFLETPFSGDERHQRRIDLMKDYERSVRA